MTARPIVALSLLISIASPLAQEVTRDPDLSFGVIDHEGFLIPLARLHENDWTKLLTVPSTRDSNYRMTATARSLPRDGWRFWSLGGKEAVPLELGREETMQFHSFSELTGLRQVLRSHR